MADVRYLSPNEKDYSDELAELYPQERWLRDADCCKASAASGPTGFSALSCSRLSGHTGPHVAYVRIDRDTHRHGYGHKQICAYWMQE